jgi:hypothetical protein
MKINFTYGSRLTYELLDKTKELIRKMRLSSILDKLQKLKIKTTHK